MLLLLKNRINESPVEYPGKQRICFMKIKINGQERELNQSQDLQSVISRFCKDTRRVIAELNGQIVKSPSWDKTPVKEGDSIELVSFVGGG